MNENPIASVAAIVVTWNGGEEAAQAVRSLAAQHVPGREFQVVVVDNGSADDTVSLVRAAGASVLELGENLGYGTAANRGMARLSADAYVICNQDAEYQPGFISALADALAADERVGAVTAQVRLAGEFVPADDEDAAALVGHDGARWRRTREGETGVALLNSTGNQVTRSGNGRDRGWLAPVGTECPQPVFGVHGGACMLRAAAVEPLGGFDERYFMYYEDTDLSWRLRDADWRIHYVPEAVSVHRHAGSTGTASPQFVEWNTRNRLWCALANGPLSMRVRARLRTVFSAAKVLPAWLGRGEDAALASARIRGAFAGLRGGRRILAARRTRAADRARAPRSVSSVGPVEASGRVDGRVEASPSLAEPVEASQSARVLLDFTSLPTQLGGVGRYLEGLATGLEAAGEQPVILVRPEHAEHFRELAPSAQFHEAPRWVSHPALRFAWEQTGLLRVARKLGVDAVHSPHYTFPLAAGLRRIVTVHDATFFSDPDAHTAVKRRFFQWWLRLATSADVQLVAPSAATAREIEKFAGLPRRPILVAHHGVDRDVFHEPTASEIAAFAADHELVGERWIAFLGTIEPRKRVGELVRAHRAWVAQDPDAPLLLISGARGWDDDAAAELDLEASRSDSQVRELGYLPLEQLRALLGGAEAFCYPSIAEGFGLPVLEAMSCGVPVVTTRLTALPEVGGDAVEYCDPDASSIRASLQGLSADPARRAALRERGLQRAATFTWERCARIHATAYTP